MPRQRRKIPRERRPEQVGLKLPVGYRRRLRQLALDAGELSPGELVKLWIDEAERRKGTKTYQAEKDKKPPPSGADLRDAVAPQTTLADLARGDSLASEALRAAIAAWPMRKEEETPA